MTLNQTWVLCLRMWQWIAKEWEKGNSVDKMKERWLEKNGYDIDIVLDCFFCDYANGNCKKCPGVLVDPKFFCHNDSKYHYYYKPKAFYKELLRLNRIRKQN